MSISRRRILGAGAVGTAALFAPDLVRAQAVTKTQVWVQLTTGGKPYPPTLQEMFLDPMFFGMESAYRSARASRHPADASAASTKWRPRRRRGALGAAPNATSHPTTVGAERRPQIRL